MTPPVPFPLYRVAGSHQEIGAQLGEIGGEDIARSVEDSFAVLPAGRTEEGILALALEYRAFTQPRLPWLLEELDACAASAGVDPTAFFATTVEELWYAPEEARTQAHCTDLVAGPSATADGHLLVGHNNDLSPGMEAELAALEISVPGDPTIFQLGGIPWLSVGWNAAGLSLTGNELAPNDEPVGISRSHQVLDMLRAASWDDFLGRALREDRASSYNNVLTGSGGQVANVEGSATDAEVTGLDDAGHLVHTNHYVCDRMIPFEGDPAYAKRSAVRYRRGTDLLAATEPGSVTPAALRTMLSDHEDEPNALCRHPERGMPDEKTVFWCVADVTDGRIAFGRGNPCDSTAQTYEFADYARS
jgi:isopenicillin-N N-acyltransferase-like protein